MNYSINIDDILFSVHDYDSDGDAHEYGIYLHFGGVRIKFATSIEDFEEKARRILNMKDEITENYIVKRGVL